MYLKFPGFQGYVFWVIRCFGFVYLSVQFMYK